MKRLQSRAAIRRGLARAYLALQSLSDDPVTRLVGTADFEPEHHDDIAYE